MATRFRLTSDTTAPDVSPTLQLYTHSAPATLRRKLLLSDSSTLTTTAYTPDAADHIAAGDAFHAQFVSDLMSAGITFTSGNTIKFAIQCLEDNAGNNLQIQLYIRIVDSSGVSEQRVLRTKVLEGTEIATSLTNRFLSTTQDGANYTTVAGDRLVIEFSVSGTPVATGGVQGHNAQLRWGGGGAGGDLGENDTDTGTTLNPWIEFAPTITFPITRTYTENLGASESYSRVSNGIRAFAENLGHTDAYDRRADALRIFAENLGFGSISYLEIPVAVALGAFDPQLIPVAWFDPHIPEEGWYEYGPFQDVFLDVESGTTFERTFAELLGLHDNDLSKSAIVDLNLPAELLGYQDALLRKADAARVYVDSEGHTDIFSRRADAIRAVANSMCFIDAYARRADGVRAFVDLLGESDAYKRLANANRLFTDLLGLHDIATLILVSSGIKTIAVAENLGLKEDPIEVEEIIELLLSPENLGLQDTATLVLFTVGLTIHAIDSMGLLNPTFTRQAFADRSLPAEQFGFHDTYARRADAIRIATDLLGELDQFARTANALRRPSENLGGSDAFSRHADAIRKYADNFGLHDAPTLLLVGAGVQIIMVSELLGLRDTYARRADAKRLVADNLGLVDAANLVLIVGAVIRAAIYYLQFVAGMK